MQVNRIFWFLKRQVKIEENLRGKETDRERNTERLRVGLKRNSSSF